MTIILVIAVIIGLGLAFTIGANDVANAFATSVGAKAITLKQALLLAAILEFSGAVFFGKQVTETIRKGIVDPTIFSDPNVMLAGAFAALLGAMIWVAIATKYGLPVSTTHSIVGGMAGFGIAAAGIYCVKWVKMFFIFLSWILSPIFGAIMAFIVFKIISILILHKSKPFDAAKKYAPLLVGSTFFIISIMFFKEVLHYNSLKMPFIFSSIIFIVSSIISFILLKKSEVKKNELQSTENIFKKLQIMTACYVSLAHGANDVANAIGPLAVIYSIAKLGDVTNSVPVPKYLLALGGIGISLGCALWGYKVMQTIGEKITEVNNSRGFSMEFSTATTVLLASVMGFPISSTHTIVGSVVGVGFARGIGALNIKVIKEIILSWFITVPTAAILSAIFFKIFFLFL